MSRPTPRRSSSRAATPRPRRLAGGRPPAGPAAPEAPEDPPEVDETDAEPPPTPTDDWPMEDQDDDGSLLRSARVTRILLSVAAAIALVLVAEAAWLVVSEWTDDPPKPAAAAESSITVPDGRPVQPTQLAWQEGVEAAAKAAQKVIGRTFQKYDEEVEEATGLMTPDFAEEYRQTTGDVREEFVARKTTVEVRVVGQGVVRANDTELQALLFIDSYVIRGRGDDARTTRTPYRAVFTMVNTDAGWLVDGIDTQ
jgi:Mce-associated membrane protein